MGISAILNIAVSGMQANTHSLTASARNVAGVTTSLPGTSDIDLGQEMLDAVRAEIGFKANAAVWETGADMWDVLASIKRD
ncbi:flagellar basal body rod protein [Ciceribacter thiooxidans]|uniref:Flagellar basal body rod protein n=1 Tax=Ciceribacter thiooxidans TaxID=1969821 RepID=A0ABV7I4Q9_9HYPH|nr:flagellar basal body rod protein [Ciceribacter thiooxidans]